MSVPRSKISWTDYSGGPANFVIRGRAVADCEASRGCTNCYAAAILRRNSMTPEHTTIYPDKLRRLARAKFEPGDTPFRRGPGSRPLVFICDMGDLFHDAVPGGFIRDALDAMEQRADVDWQVLTKRPARMAEIARKRGGWPPNVWAGTTVEDQRAADERIPLLLQVLAKVRFLSMEPLLERVDLRRWLCCPLCARGESAQQDDDGTWFHARGAHLGMQCPTVRAGAGLHTVDWLIVGRESGPKRRPFDPDWARSLRDQCAAAGVAYFYKQGSDLRPGANTYLWGAKYQEFPA